MMLVQPPLGRTLVGILWWEETDKEKQSGRERIHRWGKKGSKADMVLYEDSGATLHLQSRNTGSRVVSLSILGTYTGERTISLGYWRKYDSIRHICSPRRAKMNQSWLTKECANLDDNKLLSVEMSKSNLRSSYHRTCRRLIEMTAKVPSYSTVFRFYNRITKAIKTTHSFFVCLLWRVLILTNSKENGKVS